MSRGAGVTRPAGENTTDLYMRCVLGHLFSELRSSRQIHGGIGEQLPRRKLLGFPKARRQFSEARKQTELAGAHGRDDGYDVSGIQSDGEQLHYLVLSVAEKVSDNTLRISESEFASYNLDTRVEAVEDAIGLLPPNPALDALMRLGKKQRGNPGSDQ